MLDPESLGPHPRTRPRRTHPGDSQGWGWGEVITRGSKSMRQEARAGLGRGPLAPHIQGVPALGH